MKEDGSRGVQFVRIEAFVPASNGLGVYGYIRKGKMASVSGSICTSTYPDKKTGETIFRQALSAHMVTLLDNVSNKKCGSAGLAFQAGIRRKPDTHYRGTGTLAGHGPISVKVIEQEH